MMHIDKFSPGGYFTVDERTEIVGDIIHNIMASISPVLIEQLCMIYKKESLEQMIFEKTSMLVIKELEEISNMDNNNDTTTSLPFNFDE